jgi:hypothetical protein
MRNKTLVHEQLYYTTNIFTLFETDQNKYNSHLPSFHYLKQFRLNTKVHYLWGIEAQNIGEELSYVIFIGPLCTSESISEVLQGERLKDKSVLS